MFGCSSSLTVDFFASGSGWQGGSDEWWGIDNVSVTLDSVEAVPEPSTLILVGEIYREALLEALLEDCRLTSTNFYLGIGVVDLRDWLFETAFEFAFAFFSKASYNLLMAMLIYQLHNHLHLHQ